MPFNLKSLFVFVILSTTFLLGLVPVNAAEVAAEAPTGTIRGEVSDAVTARSVDAATARLFRGTHTLGTTRSNAAGEFVFDAVPEGVYTLEVKYDGYLKAIHANVRVILGKVTPVSFELVRAERAEKDLEEVVATARPAALNPLAAANAVNFSRDEIRRTPGAGGDVFRALDVLPGVVATGEFSNFTVRGHGPRDNLIVIDGIPFDKVVYFEESLGSEEDGGGGGRYSIFAPEVIGNADFSAGGWRAAEGGKFGSLLELEVAQGNPDSPALGAKIDIAGVEVDYDGPAYVAGDTGILFSARDYDFSGLFEAIDEADLGVPEFSDLLFKSVTDWSDRHRFEFLSIHTHEEFSRTLEHVFLESQPDDDTDLEQSEEDSSLSGFTWHWFPGNSARLRNIVYVSENERSSLESEAQLSLAGSNPTRANTPVRDLLTVREQEETLGWRSDFSTVLSSGDIVTAGVHLSRVSLALDRRLESDWIRFVYDQTDFRPDPDQQYIVLTPERENVAFDARETRTAAYAGYSFELGADMSLAPGMRYIRDGFSGQSYTAPRLTWNWLPSSSTRVWAGAGVFYQTPRYLDLAVDPANTKLESERANHFSVGYSRYLNDDLQFRVEGYSQRLEDLIVFEGGATNTVSNIGEGRSAGFDLALIRRMSDGWSWSMAYSYSQSQRNDNLGAGDYDADWHRPHAFGIVGAWEINDRWSFSAKWKYASGRPTDAFVVHGDVLADTDPAMPRFSKELTRKNAGRHAVYNSFSLRLDYRRRVGAVSVIGFVDILNVFGRQNVNEFEWDESLGVNEPEGLETALPIVGLKFEY